MKFRITPLNIATALLLVLSAYVFIYGIQIPNSPFQHWKGTITIIFLFFAIVVFYLDMMLRNFFPETKKLWLVELSFIALTAVILLLVK
ncbi:hypothetical protein KXQ82_05175 [Mucilaginibacter sp. HMF5004]|uniref:hypothetical protein n=1 Tax=Mucilaginibacter rivuli TaxID=2857527 RepID=UPI001C5DCFF2|nr:hypothetical protein [Mucilaginibacter rivuli]MBW4889093.1 hypothetical protein [Mucilaginibacter rivuli]